MKKNPILYLLLLCCIFLRHPAYGDIEQWDALQQLYTCHSLSSAEGLGNNQVTSILEDKDGFIWIATRASVDRFDGKTVKNYSLYENDFNIYSFDKTYTYNVRSRNERNVEHLIITNIQPTASVHAI